MKIRNRFHVCRDMNGCLLRLKYDETLAVASSLAHIRSYRPLADAEIFCLVKDQERIFDYPITMLAQRNFHLLPTINVIILELIEHGIIEKWLGDNMPFRMQKKNAERKLYDQNFANGLPAPTDNAIIITITHIFGSILILCVGNCIATIIFFIEIWTDHKMKLMYTSKIDHLSKRIRFQRRFWIICHNCISDDRLLKKKN